MASPLPPRLRQTSTMANWNGARYQPGTDRGHYESWFVRATDPRGLRAFWLRYTVFSPRGPGHDAVGDLWAVVSDRATGVIAPVKQSFPIASCSFAADRLDVQLGDARLTDRAVVGTATESGHAIRWDLALAGGGPPLLLLPDYLYNAPFPRAKSVVCRPLARFSGTIEVDGTALTIADWVGSQNHNWGSRHTDRYAWGQVAGFDDAPDAFLECSTARLKLGPVWTPPLSPVVLRLGAETLTWNGLVSAVRNRGTYSPFHWRIRGAANHGAIEVRMDANEADAVSLRYPNPPGGEKRCRNTNLAQCEVVLDRPGQPPVTLRTNRAAFEILDAL